MKLEETSFKHEEKYLKKKMMLIMHVCGMFWLKDVSKSYIHLILLTMYTKPGTSPQ